ncbi:MAG TPA: hypothetical protein VGK31_12660 [Thermoanaerobaculia bacterium]
MKQNLSVLQRPAYLFATAAAIITASCTAIVRTEVFAANPDVIAWGVTLDLMVTIPLLYYVIIVRTGVARPLTIVPVFVAGAVLAALVLPRAYQQTQHALRLIVAPAEVLLIILLVRKLAAMRQSETHGDPLVRFHAAAAQILGKGPASAFVASEVAVMWYAFFGWNRKPDVPHSTRAFTVHERSGWGSVVACIIVLIVAESIGLHLLVQLWSRSAAWIVTSLDTYGLLWLLGDYNALRLRPSILTKERLRIRYGLRWSVDVSRDQIAAVRAASGETDWKRSGVLKVAMIDDPRYIIELREPILAVGLVGMQKKIDAIAIAPDDDSVIAELKSSRD